SNHPGARALAETQQIDFYEFPITPDTKLSQEAREIDLLKGAGVDFIFLARYHQILSGEFIRAFSSRIINIHHSFLPAFAGKNPYAQAYEKGVKIIGATSHYVTEALDEGPIIEQDTVRVSHRDALQDLIRKGEDLEKAVSARAIRLFLEKRILRYGNKTVVFD
ncbi:MAG: formyltetrahydrofolate deformylase, partial [Candidatus Omnitrophota bacterium]